MITKILNNTFIQYFITGLLLLGAMLCIFTPSSYFFKSMSEYAVQMMFGYLFLGLFFLLSKQPKLMFVSFIACSFLAIHLKINTNADLKTPGVIQDQAIIEVALVDVSNINEDFEGTLDAMLTSDASLLAVPDIDPFLYEYLKDTLSNQFPYCTPRVGFDPAITVFSKYEIFNQDTFFVEGLPNIMGSIKAEGNGRELYFVTSSTLPPFYSRDYDKLKKLLERVANKAKAVNAPVITLADYNLVQWSDEIYDFRAMAKLKDSRRGFSPAAKTGNLLSGFLDSPSSHIFFSEHFTCTGFENLRSSNSTYLGVKGSFQFSPILLQ